MKTLTRIIFYVAIISFTFNSYSQQPSSSKKVAASKVIALKVSQTGVDLDSTQSLIIRPIPLNQFRPIRYARSFCDLNGDIHVAGFFEVSQQDSGSLIAFVEAEPIFKLTSLNESKMNTFFSKQGFFIALNNQLRQKINSTYKTKIWRSVDDLKTIEEDSVTFILPEAGKVNFGTSGEWAGLFCHRALLQLKDESLLVALYGNFETDTIKPSNPWSKMETKYKMRAFVARSTDNGKNWHYLSSVATPETGKHDDSEGYNEWSMIQLNDDRIMAVIRTGHFTPFVVSYSHDEGKTWSVPVPAPELGPGGCDPYLLKLDDGRIALSYGEMVQPKTHAEFNDDFVKKCDHRRRSRLAISTNPTADYWQTYNITEFGDRTAYSSIYQVKADMILYQTDLELYQIKLRSENSDPNSPND